MMLRIDLPNHNAALGDLAALESIFDMRGSRLGADLLDVTADTIYVCMVMQSDADGTPWPPLGPTYESWKQTVAPGQPIGVLFHTMRQPVHIYGRRSFQVNTAEMTYGTSPEAQLHASRFQEGQAVTGWPNHKPRPFYYLGSVVAAAADRLLDDHFIRRTS